MNTFAVLLLAFWPLIAGAFFVALPLPRAALTTYVAGWLFLPLITLNVQGLPPYGKFTATGLALLVWLPLFGGQRLASFRLCWWDIPMALWCVCPLFSSLTNNLGVYDGAAGVWDHLLSYGVPYVTGRICLKTFDDWRFATWLFVVAAVIYWPLCVFEIRMSPQLHGTIFGVGGRPSYEMKTVLPFLYYSPTVFMNSAFEVSTMFLSVALVSFWAWRTHAERILGTISNVLLFAGFSLMTFLCQKLSAIGLLILGLTTLMLVEKTRAKWPMGLLILIPIVYMGLFLSGEWHGDQLSGSVESVASARRARSLQFRLHNDIRLVDKALQRPLFGWGGWGRNRVYNEEGEDISTTDSMWTITLGTKGLLGLAAQTAIYVVPVLLFVSTFSYEQWKTGASALVFPFLIVVSLQLWDHLFNAFPNAIYPILLGAITQSTYTSHRQGATAARGR